MVIVLIPDVLIVPTVFFTFSYCYDFPSFNFLDHFSVRSCHPCTGIMLILSISVQFYHIPEGTSDFVDLPVLA